MSRSRRDLFTSWFGTVRQAAAAARTDQTRTPATVLRPPGALQPDDRFLECCTRCGDCITACPPRAIFAFHEADRPPLPAIEPTKQPCLLCDTVPCVPACPEGALVAPDSAAKIRLGIARVNPLTCRTFRGQVCDLCFQACPYPGSAIMLIGGRPLVGSGSCTGCGLCEKACPERPRAIAVIPERHLIPGLRVPKGEASAG